MAGQQWNFSGIPMAGERPEPNAGQRDPLSALSKATGISAAPEDPQYRYPADAPKGQGGSCRKPTRTRRSTLTP